MDQATNDFLKALPLDLQKQVHGYSERIYEKMPEILRDHHIKDDFRQEATRQIAFFATLRYCWLKAKGQKILFEKTLDIAETHNISAFQRGSDYYSRSSTRVSQATELEMEFRQFLEENGIFQIVDSSSLSEMVEELRKNNQWT